MASDSTGSSISAAHSRPADWCSASRDPIPAAQAQADAVKGGAAFEPNAFVRIGRDNSVTVIVKHLEMGQGTYTGLATLVAEELDADWAQVRVEGAPADAKLYNNLFWGPRRAPAAAPRWPIRWSSCATPARRRAPCWWPPRPRMECAGGRRSRSANGVVMHARPAAGRASAAGGGGRAPAGAGRVTAQGPEGFQADRQARRAQGQRAPRPTAARSSPIDLSCPAC